mgnify:CR=1 FL=1
MLKLIILPCSDSNDGKSKFEHKILMKLNIQCQGRVIPIPVGTQRVLNIK